MRLSDLPIGARGVIHGIDQVMPTTLRLMELGFTTGSTVEMVRRAPFGDPIEVRIHNTRICLRVSDAASFDVETDGVAHVSTTGAGA